jgi:beta-phosphoglucomutase
MKKTHLYYAFFAIAINIQLLQTMHILERRQFYKTLTNFVRNYFMIKNPNFEGKFKSIIFDMDGTSVDTNSIWKSATEKYLKEIGLNYRDRCKIHEKIKGLASTKIGSVIKIEAGLKHNPKEIIEDIGQIGHKLMNSEVQYINGFEEFHNKLRQNNIPTAIATNADHYTVNMLDRKLNLKKHFGKNIYTASDAGGIYKPSPEVYLHAAKKLNIDPKSCIAIEDSICGVSAAKNAGMKCIAIDTSKIKESLKDADLIVDNYKDIPIKT